MFNEIIYYMVVVVGMNGIHSRGNKLVFDLNSPLKYSMYLSELNKRQET